MLIEGERVWGKGVCMTNRLSFSDRVIDAFIVFSYHNGCVCARMKGGKGVG